MTSMVSGSNTRWDTVSTPVASLLSRSRRLSGRSSRGAPPVNSAVIVRTAMTPVRHNPPVVRLALALAAALAGLWGFFLAAAGYVFQPAQVGPDHGAWGAIAGLILLPVALFLGRE